NQATLHVFVSLSLGEEVLKKLYGQVSQVRRRLILRGLVEDSWTKTQEALGKLKIGIDIDPPAFEEFSVTQVPTFILREGERLDRISGTLCNSRRHTGNGSVTSTTFSTGRRSMTKMPTLFLILIFYPASFINASQTSAQKGHAKGQRFAADQGRTLSGNTDGIVPHYAGINTPETQLDPYSLNQKAQVALSDPESAGHFVMTSEGKRQHFDIDPQTDSLLKASKDAIANPESYLNVTEDVYDEPTDVVEIQCTKPLEYLLTVERIYTPHVKTTTKKVLKTFSADNWEDHGFYNRVRNPDKTKLIDLAGIGFVFGRKHHKGPVTNLSSHTKNWLFTRWRARLYPNRHKSHQ
ncbi:hypothetical protein AWC38_SpisGene25545, partial [Stylophora pistillata]